MTTSFLGSDRVETSNYLLQSFYKNCFVPTFPETSSFQLNFEFFYFELRKPSPSNHYFTFRHLGFEPRERFIRELFLL